jgi:23S rRNA G2069 N7-methylase RlmK/C1962 C5-methylase RlmI
MALAATELPEPPSLGGSEVPKTPLTTDKIGAQAEMLANRLGKRYRHLRKWARRIGCDAFRLYDRDIPEIPLVLDVYAVPGTNPVSAVSPEGLEPVPAGPFVAGAWYKRQSENPSAGETEMTRRSAMRRVIGTALAIPDHHIFLKERERGSGQYAKIDNRCVTTTVHERDMRFMVNLSDYLDTGLFLDTRNVRSWLREGCGGKRVLNLFCYTGSLSVAAARGGAASVDSVDLSSTYLAWARKNFALNGYADERHQFIRADALRFIEYAISGGLTWDLIILDPPGFSNSKKMTGVFDVRRGHERLIRDCLSRLAQNGTLLFGVKRKRFSLDPRAFPAATVTDITRRMRGEDFGARNGGKWYVFQTREPR